MPTIVRLERKRHRPNKVKNPLRVAARQAVYQSEEWQRLRLAYMEAHPICELCAMQGVLTPAVDVHHIYSPFAADGRGKGKEYDWRNLMSLCRDCHGTIHGDNREAELYKWYGKERPDKTLNWH